jgi:hypothetical protein
VTVEVKIGVQYAVRELVIETEETPEAIESALAAALSADSLLSLTDIKGKKVFVPAAKISYIELGTTAANVVGFRS